MKIFFKYGTIDKINADFLEVVSIMNRKRHIFLLKLISAMLIAFIILNAFCILYYNLPAHRSSKTHSTDHIWQEEKFYSRGTEGFASGVIDANGFNNLQTYEKGNIDLLMMGSSHVEAFNVAQDKNAVALLNQKFKNDNLDMNAYNIGISGHAFETCLNNLDNAVDEFAPQKYVVIETSSVSPNATIIDNALNGTLASNEVSNSSIVNFLQRIPYVRLLYAQLKHTIKNNKNTVPDQSENNVEIDKPESYAKLDNFMKQSIKKCQDANVQIIVFYNCKISIDKQGEVKDRTNLDDIAFFKKVCDDNGVIFLDMHDAFAAKYKETQKLPHGFANTQVGQGHINETGHQVVADEIYAIINKQNEGK